MDGWELADTLGDLRRRQLLDGLRLCFNPYQLEHIASEIRSARHVQWYEYAITGEVVFCGESNWVLDFGIPAACHERFRPAGADVGSYLAGTVGLLSLTAGRWGDDLFEPPAPPLAHTWRIERIWLETTPWLEIAPRAFERADVPRTFVEIEATDHEGDDSVGAAYILECQLLDTPATH